MLESKSLLNKEQCGFRHNHSTLDALTSIHTNICSPYKNKQHLIAIALDIKKTYDTVWKNRVLTILHNWQLNGNLLRFIKNVLANRKFCVKVNNHLSSSHDIVNGLLEDLLSALLFFLSPLMTFVKKSLSRSNTFSSRTIAISTAADHKLRLPPIFFKLSLMSYPGGRQSLGLRFLPQKRNVSYSTKRKKNTFRQSRS